MSLSIKGFTWRERPSIVINSEIAILEIPLKNGAVVLLHGLHLMTPKLNTMLKRIPGIVAMLTLANNFLYAQTTEIVGKIRLRSFYHVYKLVTVPNCDKSYLVPPGTTQIKTEEKYTNGKQSLTIENNTAVSAGSTVNLKTDKQLEIKIPQGDTKVSLYQDDKDKSKLYINRFLYKQQEIIKGTSVVEYTVEYPTCDASNPQFVKKHERKLETNEYYNYRKIKPSDAIEEKWFYHSAGIEVYDANGKLDYYLVNLNNADDKYILKLENRIYIPYNTSSLYLTALVIPFKVRSGFTKNGHDVKSDVTAGANIGVFGGWKIGRSYITNRAGTFSKADKWSIRVGPFAGLSASTLDSVATIVGKEPMQKDDKETIAVVSMGVGVTFEVKGLQMGLFGGWDFGTGTAAVNWNYHKRFWYGVGLGYKITDLFGQ